MDRLSDMSTNFTCLRYGECTASSIVKALDNFLFAVQQMKDIVMVPSRLLDMKSTITEVQHQTAAAVGGDALVPFVDGENADTCEFPLFTFYHMLQMIRNELISGSSGVDASGGDQDHRAGGFGDSGPDDDDDDDDATVRRQQSQMDEQVHRLANAFQQHLQGLFTILRQLTSTADYLAKRYQDDVDKRDVSQSFW